MLENAKIDYEKEIKLMIKRLDERSALFSELDRLEDQALMHLEKIQEVQENAQGGGCNIPVNYMHWYLQKAQSVILVIYKLIRLSQEVSDVCDKIMGDTTNPLNLAMGQECIKLCKHDIAELEERAELIQLSIDSIKHRYNAKGEAKFSYINNEEEDESKRRR